MGDGGRPFRIFLGPEENENPPRHVLSEKVARASAAYYDGHLLFVALHVDSHPVAHVSPYVEFSAPHAVAQYVPRVAFDYDLAAVHRVPYIVLRVALDDDSRAVHEGRKVVAGHALDDYFTVSAKPVAYVV